MKKMVIIGTGGDVIVKERGEFLNNNFDEIVIMNQAIFKFKDYSKYLGDPTIWSCCGWYNKDPIFDPSVEDQKLINSIIEKSKIHEVWYNTSVPDTDFDFTVPNYIKTVRINNYRISNNAAHSLGLQSLLYALTLDYELYYFGIDSYRKSYHFYTNNDKPENMAKIAYEHWCYLSENRIIKGFINEGKLKHIDSIYDK